MQNLDHNDVNVVKRRKWWIYHRNFWFWANNI